MTLSTPLLFAGAITVGIATSFPTTLTIASATSSPGVVTATGHARSNLAEVGECVGFTLDVTGTQDGVAIEPITATLTGPYDGWPPVGSVADGAPVGSFSATWTGSEWNYSAECVSLPVAGGYAWTLENSNDPEGLDLIIHDASIVEAVEPAIDRPDDDDSVEEDNSGTIGEDDETVNEAGGGDGSSPRPQLAATGANDSVFRSAAIGGATGLIGGLTSLWIRALRKRKAAAEVAVEEAGA